MDDWPRRDKDTQQLMTDLGRREQRRRRRLRIRVLATVGVIGVLIGVGLAYLVLERQSPSASLSSLTESLRVSAADPLPTAPVGSITTTTSLPQHTTTSKPPDTTTSTEQRPQPVLSFDSTQAMVHVEQLAGEIGVRRGGTQAEADAAQYAVNYLHGLGYEATLTDVPIPNGLTSHNVIAVKRGSSPLTVVVGGHMDSKRPAPGGNDNASGSATVLELARDLGGADTTPTVIFVLFGNEEMIDSNEDHHHYGSRAFVQKMTASDRVNVVAMISLDMVGYGDTLNIRTMGQGPGRLRDMIMSHASATGISLSYLKDSSSFGYSDHEPFERAGYPAAWLEWREDPVYHTVDDTYEHCSADRIQEAGALVLGFLTGLRPSDLEELQAAKS
jgi:aminopeptidase YwaD